MRDLFELLQNNMNENIMIYHDKISRDKYLFVNDELRYVSKKELSNLLHLSHNDFLNKIDQKQLFCEKIAHEPQLIIFGAGHVALACIKLAKLLGYRTIVIDDREYFCNLAIEHGASKVICCDFKDSFNQIFVTKDTYFIVVTRGHGYDELCARFALQTKTNYVGMLGSKRKVAIIKEHLLLDGISQETLHKLYAPIGLEIDAEGPMEIAVSIISQIIKIKHIQGDVSVYDEEILTAILSDKPKIFCMITEKKGSTPRKVGTKMIVFENGNIVGSVGGGKAEKDVIDSALSMFNKKIDHLDLTLDMCNISNYNEDMVCGGYIKVSLELI